MSSGSSADIYIVGTGMVGYSQITLETQSVLESASTIFVVHYQPTVLDYLQQFTETPVVDLSEAYEEDGERREAYEEMAETVMEASVETDDPVVFALYGHPMVFVSPVRWIRERAPDRGLSVETLPGISSMDCLYADIGLDPSKNGIQMFEATDLLLREFDLNPHVPLMLWQVGSLETELYSVYESSPERFTGLKQYLQRFYPDDHTVSLLMTATYPIGESERIDFELREFESLHDQVKHAHTLYVPPKEEKGVQREDLYEQVHSEDHLETITDRSRPLQ
jgi:uncharacterized protein YabN with tetrapyrrole methylase and pyrophosphatase domain